MRRGSRNLVPTILAAEAAIIGLLFVGHFTMPDGETAPVDLGLTDAPSVPSVPIPPVVETALQLPAAVETLGLPEDVRLAAVPAPALPVETIPIRAVAAVSEPSLPAAAVEAPQTAEATRPPAAPDAADDLEALVQSALWASQPVAVDPLPWPDPGDRRVPQVTVAALAPESVPVPDTPPVSGPLGADPVAARAREPDAESVPAPPHRPAPPPARAVSAAAVPAPAPTTVAAPPTSGTVVIEGRVFACSALSAALQARFASCGGAPVAQVEAVGTVEINGATVTCDRLSAALRSRFGCGS